MWGSALARSVDCAGSRPDPWRETSRGPAVGGEHHPGSRKRPVAGGQWEPAPALGGPFFAGQYLAATIVGGGQ